MSLLPDPSAAEVLAASFDGRGSMSYQAVTRPVSVRIPVHTLIRIDAFAAHSGLTRTQVLCRFLDAGLDSTWEHLSPGTREAICDHTVAAATALGFPEFSREDLSEVL